MQFGLGTVMPVPREARSISSASCDNVAEAMARPSSFANVEIETGERSQRVEPREPDLPFHIAVLGDFS